MCHTANRNNRGIRTQMLDEGNFVDAVYLDFRKAFDTAAHERLLIKLKGYGVNGKVFCHG